MPNILACARPGTKAIANAAAIIAGVWTDFFIFPFYYRLGWFVGFLLLHPQTARTLKVKNCFTHSRPPPALGRTAAKVNVMRRPASPVLINLRMGRINYRRPGRR